MELDDYDLYQKLIKTFSRIAERHGEQQMFFKEIQEDPNNNNKLKKDEEDDDERKRQSKYRNLKLKPMIL